MSAAHDIDLVWQDLAACAGTPIDWWFPQAPKNDDGGHGCAPPEALALCARCEVRSECLQHAIAFEGHGVWAGMSMKQIKRLRRVAGVRLGDSDPVADERARAARRMHERGAPPQRIAEVLDVNLRTVFRLLAAAGVELTEPDDWRRTPRGLRT